MATTEQEIFDRLASSFKAAAECCDHLATSPRKGPLYRKLRDELRLIEGAARQAAHWRQDARWLVIGMQMGTAHQKAGDWLRSRAPALLFRKLAEALRKGHASAEKLRTGATGRTGMILPKPQTVFRDHVPVGWRATAGGLLMPGV